MIRKWITWLVLIALLASCRGASPSLSPSPSPSVSPHLMPKISPTPTSLFVSEPPTRQPDEEPGAETPAMQPTAQIDPALNLEELHPGSSLVVHFNQPMQAGSDPLPLYTLPFLPGNYTWDDSRTSLTFSPEGGFSSGKDYQVYISPRLSGQNGKPIDPAPQWSLHVKNAPSVTATTPGVATVPERNPEIQVAFDRPMSEGSLLSALTVSPEVPIQAEVVDHLLQIRLAEALAPGVRYAFTIGAQATDREGIPLSADYRWEIGAPAVIASYKAANDPRQVNALDLNLNYAISGLSWETVARITDMDGNRVAGEWTWESPADPAFKPDAPLDGSRKYRLDFRGDLQKPDGEKLPPPPAIFFTTPAPILAYGPEDNYSPLDVEFYIQFSEPVERSSVEAAFNIEPALSGSFHWEENRIVFTPDSLATYQNYQVTLATSARKADGSPLLISAFTWSVYTGGEATRPAVSFGYSGPNAQVLDFDGRRAVQFDADGTVASVDFSLHRMNLEQFLGRYASNFRGVAGFAWAPISLSGTSLQASWTQAIQFPGAGYNQGIFETFIPQDVPAGLYVLRMSARETQAQMILVLTRNTLMVKQADGQLTAWITRINGAAVPGASISVYARDGTRLAQGRADDSGVYTTVVSRDPQPLIVVATDNEQLTGAAFDETDITVSGLSNEWRGSSGRWWGWWQTRPKPRQYSAHIYTDRPIYRPGQTVYFKAMLRQEDDAVLSLPPEGTPVTVRIRDARDNVVQTFAMQTNAFGTLSGDFNLAEGAMLGNYNVEVLPGEDPLSAPSLRQVFKVQDYRKPDYKVSVTTDASSYVAGDDVQVNVQVEYYFGEPVANASLNIHQYGLTSYVNYWWVDENVDVPEYTWGAGIGDAISLSTDENGQASFSLPASLTYWDSPDYYYSDWGSSLRKSTIGLEVTADDGSRQTVSNFAVIEVYNEPVSVELDLDSWLARPGEPLTVHGMVSSYAGQPMPDQAVILELRRFSLVNRRFDEIVAQAESHTDAGGKVEIELLPEQSGYYQVRMSTPGSTEAHPQYDNDWLYVYRPSDDWANRYNTSDLSISTDRESYAPGDTAQLIIESSFSGSALLSFERGTTRRTQLVTLTAPMTLVPVIIQAGDAPNIFIAVNAYQAEAAELNEDTYYSLTEARLYTAATEVQVPVTDKSLTITITPDREAYNPRQEATFTLQVTDVDGQPVQAELSLAVVDEAIYALSEELSGPILDSFYGSRAHLVNTYNSMALRRDLFGGGRGGGGEGDVSPGNPRADFPDTAFWFPALLTDEDGRVEVSVTLPDNLTTWRLTARAITRENQVGEAYTNILTQQPVVVRPILPRTLVAGDRALLAAAVHNYSQARRTFEVRLETLSDAGLQTLDPPEQAIALDAGEVRYVSWWVQAELPGEAQVLVSARPSDDQPGQDAVRLTLPVQPLAVPQVDVQSGTFKGSFNTILVRPEEAAATSRVVVELTPSIAGSLLEGLEYLTGYPYGCVEQTMSRALPNAVIGRAFHQLGVEDAQLSYDLPPMINAGLQRLYGYQHNDGGWGWWFDDETDAYQTAWVVFGLAVTRDAGYEVSPQVIDRGVSWLNGNLTSMDPRTQAYALYSLAYAGNPHQAANQALALQAQDLDTFSQAALALALDRGGDTEQASVLLSMLDSSAMQQDGQVYWPSPYEDGHYYAKTMSSSVRSTALALEALLALDDDEDRQNAVVTWLMDQRGLRGWGSTNETAFSLLALSDYVLARELATADTAYTIRLNGNTLAQGSLGRSDPALRLELPIGDLEVGANALEVEVDGDQRLYYRLSSRLALEVSKVPAAGAVEVSRTYQDAETGENLEAFAPGQLIEVSLQVGLPDDGFFLIVEDPLPGGLEALNESLNTSSHEQALDSEQSERYFWQDYGYNNKEIRADRVSFFIKEARAGKKVLTYYARATTSGTFTALPATVAAMYDPAFWGRSASDQIEVLAP